MPCCILLFRCLAIAVIFYTLGAPFAAALENYCLCRRHYGDVPVCGDDAEPGSVYTGSGESLAYAIVWIGPSIMAVPLLLLL